MWLLPYFQETLICPEDAKHLRQKLQDETQIALQSDSALMASEQMYLDKKGVREFAFRGTFKGSSFYLQRFTYYPENFNPLLIGRIESSSKGTIVFVRYQLLGGILFILGLGTFVFLCSLIVFVFFQKNLTHSVLAVLFYAGSYTAMMLNFSQKLSISRRTLERVLFKE